MKFNQNITVYGDVDYRGECPTETAEQITFFQVLAKQWPDYHAIALHPKNEAKRSGKDFHRAKLDKLMGSLNTGASDIIIPGCPAFVCEMKRKDHTKSKWQPDQQPYLLAAKNAGAFVCVALGYEAALQAVAEWHNNRISNS